MKDFVKVAAGAVLGVVAVVVAKWILAPEEELYEDDYDDYEDEPDDSDDEELEYDDEAFKELTGAYYDEGYDDGYDSGYADALREQNYGGTNPAALALQDMLAEVEGYYDDAFYSDAEAQEAQEAQGAQDDVRCEIAESGATE